MNLFEAIILGLVQGLTEFLPISSSGHLELGKYLFGIDNESNFYFSIAVHGATFLSTLLVFRKDIIDLLKGFFRFTMNEETKYVFRLTISVIPVGIAGFFMSTIAAKYFSGDMTALGIQFIFTAFLLALTLVIRPKERKMTYFDSFLIGIAQAFAILPAISRSGATIAIGMLLGNNKADLARFSFLMVLVPIFGANIAEMSTGNFSAEGTSIWVIIAGFITAFVSGYFACKWMIALVRKGNMGWFAIYCLAAGVFSILLSYNVI